MKTTMLLILLVPGLAGCKPKPSAGSAPAVAEASAPSSLPADLPSPVSAQNLAGKWKGTWESKSPRDVTVNMELTLSEHEAQWNGDCRFTLNGNLTSNTREVTVTDHRISFRCDFASDSEFRFSGELADGRLHGSLEIFEHERKVSAGTWAVAKTND